MTGIKTFFNAVKTYHPSSLTWTIPVLGDQIDETTGTITGAWNGTNGGAVTGIAGTGAYSGTSGYCVHWQSNIIVAGRRRAATTFMVPCDSLVYQNNGSIADSTLTAIQTAANAMVSAYAGNLLVWSRPFPGKDAVPPSGGNPGKPAKPARTGIGVPVLLAKVPDLAVVLRSRRN
jgi:hypothetical protein